MRSFKELTGAAYSSKPRLAVVAGGDEVEVLQAISDARDKGFTVGYIVGDERATQELAAKKGLSLDGYELVDVPDETAISTRTARLAREVSADMVVKGTVNTASFLKALLDKELGFATGRLLSHIGVIEAKGYDRLFFLTDGAMNISPSLEQKQVICQNAIDLAKLLGVEPVRVAVIAAVESVNPSMPATVEAAAIAKMAERGQIRGALVDGPMALDNAISKESAAIKGINSPVAGDADVLLVPNIEVGNAVYKAMVYFAGVKAAGLVVGASIPIVLTSRSDDRENRFLSLALGAHVSAM